MDAAPPALQGVGVREALVKRFVPLRGGGVAADQNRELAHRESSCRERGVRTATLPRSVIPSAAQGKPESGERAGLSAQAGRSAGSGQGHGQVANRIRRSRGETTERGGGGGERRGQDGRPRDDESLHRDLFSLVPQGTIRRRV